MRLLVKLRLTVLFSASSRITNVFYEQYLTIVQEGLFNISLCLLPTFVVCCLLLGLDLLSGLLNLCTIIMITVDTVGVMTLWSIDYNAVALINLVTVRKSISWGFCCCSFMSKNKTPVSASAVTKKRGLSWKTAQKDGDCFCTYRS